MIHFEDTRMIIIILSSLLQWYCLFKHFLVFNQCLRIVVLSLNEIKQNIKTYQCLRG